MRRFISRPLAPQLALGLHSQSVAALRASEILLKKDNVFVVPVRNSLERKHKPKQKQQQTEHEL